MMTKDLLNLYRKEVEFKLNGKFINLNLALTDETTRYILKLASEFVKIYREYFPHEHNRNIRKDDIKDESFRCFLRFIKEFEVFPKLITAGSANLIYREVLENPQTEILDQDLKDSLPIDDYKNKTGIKFTLGKFVSALVAISRVAGDKIKSSTPSST